MKEFYSTLIRPSDLAFDIGANRGNRIAVFLSLGAKVVALEPQPRCADELVRKFEGRYGLTILDMAVGDKDGVETMRISNNDMVSSLSDDWISRVKASGRFDDSSWEQEIKVRVTTLDRLIAQYGMPDFIKVDVEGYEAEVMRGLSHRIKKLSFEYTPERIEPALAAVRRLSFLGDYVFNISRGETFAMEFSEPVEDEAAIELLTSLSMEKEGVVSGDVYAYLRENS